VETCFLACLLASSRQLRPLFPLLVRVECESRNQKEVFMAIFVRDLKGSVGVKRGGTCVNHVADQELVMDLLNKVSVSQGGTRMPEGGMTFPQPRPGFCHPVLAAAILNFQKYLVERRIPGAYADGYMDPGGITFRSLKALAIGASLPDRPSSTPHQRRTQPMSTEFAVAGVHVSGLAVGAGGAGALVAFWDLTNNLFAPYVFLGAAIGIQFPCFVTNVIDYHQYKFKRFRTANPASIHSFEGPASIARISTPSRSKDGDDGGGGVARLGFQVNGASAHPQSASVTIEFPGELFPFGAAQVLGGVLRLLP
jgi:hypothetical protein